MAIGARHSHADHPLPEPKDEEDPAFGRDPDTEEDPDQAAFGAPRRRAHGRRLRAVGLEGVLLRTQ